MVQVTILSSIQSSHPRPVTTIVHLLNLNFKHPTHQQPPIFLVTSLQYPKIHPTKTTIYWFYHLLLIL